MFLLRWQRRKGRGVLVLGTFHGNKPIRLFNSLWVKLREGHEVCTTNRVHSLGNMDLLRKLHDYVPIRVSYFLSTSEKKKILIVVIAKRSVGVIFIIEYL